MDPVDDGAPLLQPDSPELHVNAAVLDWRFRR
jgi:hypothetical protein